VCWSLQLGIGVFFFEPNQIVLRDFPIFTSLLSKNEKQCTYKFRTAVVQMALLRHLEDAVSAAPPCYGCNDDDADATDDDLYADDDSM
jgi:hypothetical protein